MRFSLVQWLQNSQWSIRTKLMSGFLSIALFMVVLTVLSIAVIGALGQQISQVYTAQEDLNQASRLATSTQRLESALETINVDLNFVASRSSDALTNLLTAKNAYAQLQSYLFEYARQRDTIASARLDINDLSDNFLKGSMSMTQATASLDLIRDDLPKMLTEFDLIREDANNQNFQSAVDRWQRNEKGLTETLTQLRGFINQLNTALDVAHRTSRQAVQDATNAQNLAQLFLLVAGLIAIIMALSFGLALTLVFTRPVERLRHRLIQLADGDLATVLDVPNRDQLGELATTFNQSIRRLGGVVEQVQSQALQVNNAATEIAAASINATQNSISQASQVAQVIVTIEELNHTAQQIAEAAAQVANAAEKALENANEGQETVRESILGINNLKNRVRTITDRILALSERSQRVGHIVDQVASIADQTHLLALNAAIESAAAGENGKRFAVVAASVKQLAERSRLATKDVQAVLSEIQAATNASVMATEQGMKEAERGVTLAHRTGDANESIIQMVERTVQLANAISLATQQQRGGSEQVVNSMRELATVIQDGASSAKQSSTLATALDQVAIELRRLSSQFRVDQPNPEPPANQGGPSLVFEELPTVQHGVLPPMFPENA